MSRAFDFYGRTIRNGDVITYPVRQGSNMWLDHGKVTAVNTDGSVQIRKPETGRRTTIRNTDNAVLAPKSVRTVVNAQIRELG